MLKPSDLGLGAEDDEALDVLDLPQLYTKPDAKTLLATLDDLSSAPPSWEATPLSGTPRSMSGASTPIKKKRKVRSEGVPRYLTKIISSPLTWIEADEEKEQIWEAASQRLSERSGRTAMGAISRTFSIPLAPGPGPIDGASPATTDKVLDSAEDAYDEYFQLVLHEPALTADNLGLKTWASSYLLAKRLVNLQSMLPKANSGLQVLELGAGTGLVGMAAAVILKAHVYLTDLPEIVPNLERNVRANSTTFSVAREEARSVSAEAAVLDWADPASFALGREETQCPPHSFPVILAADPIYSAEHPRLLVDAIGFHLTKDEHAKVVIELPLRDAFVTERRDLRERLMGLGLAVVQEGEEIGYDDWLNGRDEEELAEVTCEWSVWGWR